MKNLEYNLNVQLYNNQNKQHLRKQKSKFMKIKKKLSQ